MEALDKKITDQKIKLAAAFKSFQDMQKAVAKDQVLEKQAKAQGLLNNESEKFNEILEKTNRAQDIASTSLAITKASQEDLSKQTSSLTTQFGKLAAIGLAVSRVFQSFAITNNLLRS